MTRYLQLRTRAAAIAAAVVALVVVVGTASAGPAGAVKTFTGCLASGDGVIVKVKEGNSPKSACSSGQTLARLSGGDITKISVTGGLTLTDGGESGDVEINLDSKYTLPQGCSDGQVAKWNNTTKAWECKNDEDTKYHPGTGLVIDEARHEFSIDADYRIPGKSCTTSGEFARGFDDDGAIKCETPATGGVHAYSATVGATTLAGDTVVISKTLQAGTYLLFASVALINQDGDAAGDGYSRAECRIPGYRSGSHELVWPDEGFANPKISVSLASAITHAGGAVELRCSEESADVDVFQATLTAIKVDTLG